MYCSSHPERFEMNQPDNNILLVTVKYNNPSKERDSTEKSLEKKLGSIQGKPSIFDTLFIYSIKSNKNMDTDAISTCLMDLKSETNNLVEDIEPEGIVSAFNN